MATVNIKEEIEKYFDPSSIPANGQPEFVLFTGAIGAGKTTARRKDFSKGYVAVDACEIFCSLTNGGHGAFGKDAFDEMCAIGFGVLERAVAEKRNIVMEIIGAEVETLKGLTDIILMFGYKVDFKVVYRDPAEAYKSHVNAGLHDPAYVSAYHTEPYHLKWVVELWMKLTGRKGNEEALKVVFELPDREKSRQLFEKFENELEELAKKARSVFVEKAYVIACRAHAGQIRKGDGSPYILHPVGVALKLAKAGFSEKIIAAGLVHDVLEDTEYPETQLADELGDEVLQIVKAVTKDGDKKLSWEDAKLKYIETVRQGTEGAKAVCVADKIHNLESLTTAYQEQGEAIWGKFNRGKETKLWFERKVLDMLKETWEHPMVDEYEMMINKLEMNLQ